MSDTVNWRRFGWMLVFWALLVVGPVVYLQLSSSRASGTVATIDAVQYGHQLAQDNVGRVTIQTGGALTGEFKRPVILDAKSVQRFAVTLPVEQSEDMLKQLHAHNLEIEARAPRQDPGIVVTYLPYVFLVGLWIVLFRRFSRSRRAMKAGGPQRLDVIPPRHAIEERSLCGISHGKPEMMRESAAFSVDGVRGPSGGGGRRTDQPSRPATRPAAVKNSTASPTTNAASLLTSTIDIPSSRK
jgi:hypothetical protein